MGIFDCVGSSIFPVCIYLCTYTLCVWCCWCGTDSECTVFLLAVELCDYGIYRDLHDSSGLVWGEYAGIFFGCILALGAFFAGNTLLADDTRDLVSVTAVKSLISGEAKTYDMEMKQRQQAYLSDTAQVQVSPLTAKPELLFWEDITDNPDEWINQVVARFYRKDEVYLDEER